MTKINHTSIDFHNPAPEAIRLAVDVLASDGLIVAPTETSYGLLARADSPGALTRLYEAKQRPKSMPTAIFVDSIDSITKFAVFTVSAKRIAEKFLPGPVTLVLEASIKLDEPVVMRGKIGIRISSAPFISRLLENVDFPITATSANRSGAGSSALIPEIICAFDSSVDIYFDSGRCDKPASSVVDCASLTPRILRAEAISEKQIKAVIRKQVQ